MNSASHSEDKEFLEQIKYDHKTKYQGFSIEIEEYLPKDVVENLLPMNYIIDLHNLVSNKHTSILDYEILRKHKNYLSRHNFLFHS